MSNKKKMSEEVKEYLKRYYKEHPEKQREASIRARVKTKSIVLTHYGNGELACVACGENRVACLSIDHIEGGGQKHLNELGRRGTAFYYWLKREGFPEGYQTLCMNCQYVKRVEQREVPRKRLKV